MTADMEYSASGALAMLEGQHIDAFVTMNVAPVGTSSLLHSIQYAVLRLNLVVCGGIEVEV